MRSKLVSRLVSVFLCASVMGGTPMKAGIIHVDAAATGGNNGSSWADAFNHLQDALAQAALASKPVEIRVAQGVYKPDQGAGVTPGDRTATFQLLNGVTLKGGYAGAATADPDVRDPKQYETTLSGDLNGNDVEVNDPHQFLGTAEPTWADNSFHVVTGSGTDATAVLDGVSVTAGCKMLPLPSLDWIPRGGAGMCNEAGSPTVQRCIFRTNFSSFFGGAVYNHDGNPTFSDCAFARNGSSSGGGAMHNSNAATALRSCTFSGNVAQTMGWGGAILNEWYARAVVKDCAFTNNEAQEGGAINNRTAGVMELYNCRFDRNRAVGFGEGGAIFYDAADLRMTGCAFDQNSAARQGGAVQIDGTLFVSHCTFTGNTVDIERPSSFFGGGALCCRGGTIGKLVDTRFEGNLAGNGGAIRISGYHMDVTRCSFVGNVAWSLENWRSEGRGGAFYSEYTWVRLTDCTFDQNRALHEGGALWSQPSGKIFLTRCDFTGNGAEQGGALSANNFGTPLINCLFSGNRARQGGAIYNPSGGARSIRNCTFAANSAGDGPTFACDARNSTIDLSHCILWDGPAALWGKYALETTVTYSDFRGGYAGEGNIDIDPCFVNPGHWSNPDYPAVPAAAEDPNAVWVAGDYHLRSQGGHWDRQTKTWIRDDQTSPCIDMGNPAHAFDAEPFPNGGTVNLGAYGGTAEASKSYFGEPVCDTAIAGDINGDCKVDSTDRDLMMRNWLVSLAPVSNQPPTVVISQPLDGALIDVSPSNAIIPIIADAVDPDGSVEEVRFFIEYRAQEHWLRTSWEDNEGTDGWQWLWNWQNPQHPYPEGQYVIHAYAIDDDGALTFSPKITVTIRNTK